MSVIIMCHVLLLRVMIQSMVHMMNVIMVIIDDVMHCISGNWYCVTSISKGKITVQLKLRKTTLGNFSIVYSKLQIFYHLLVLFILKYVNFRINCLFYYNFVTSDSIIDVTLTWDNHCHTDKKGVPVHSQVLDLHVCDDCDQHSIPGNLGHGSKFC